MSKIAEQKAFEAYPVNTEDLFKIHRKAFRDGYEMAERDLGWISVKERMPEHGEWVFACIEDDGVPQSLAIAAYNERMGIWVNDKDELFHPDYWMQKRSLPKKDEQ